ncbi:MAG TPA: lipase maturation factor family protein [Acidobacteriaceae bacterium]
MDKARQLFLYLFDSEYGARNYLIARWVFLRAMGAIYFSAFFALLFQVRGLIGTHGILPAAEYLQGGRNLGVTRFWYAPTLLWFSSSDHMLMGLMWVGLIASILLIANIWPRAMLLACFLCFLSFVGAAQDFSGYQSDGMLLEAGFLSLFLAPSGLLPGWGARRPPLRAAILLLLWEWFRIYFESGVVKLESGDPTWRNLTAMYEYYQNGPLPTWIGWYLQHLPNWFHKATAGATLAMELVLVWMAFLPRRWRIVCVFVVTAWQIGVIATANYTFLNYLVLVLAFLLLDDEFLGKFVPARWRPKRITEDTEEQREHRGLAADSDVGEPGERPARPLASARLAVSVFALTWIFYATAVPLVRMFWREAPLPAAPVALLDPFRIANSYGLFAVMTPHRYEIEFQGSNDGQNWAAYPFRYKPQDVRERPRIYAPYQPRFDWNLWFASLGPWTQNAMVPRTEELLLEGDRDVLGLFAGNPFPDAPPKYMRAVLWQYWFSTPEQKREQGLWWRRQYLGTYAPTLTRLPDGQFGVLAEPSLEGPPQP